MKTLALSVSLAAVLFTAAIPARADEPTYTLEREHVRLEVPEAARGDARAPALADRLDAMVPRLLERLGAERALDGRIEIRVERDHVEQGGRTGAIDPAVLSDGRLHLVYHPDDVDFYRFELARLLLRRAGFELPPVVEDGAALWLAERWYGRAFEAWMPSLVFANVLPEAAEIGAAERTGDGSRMIFTPAVAWGLDQLPGSTLRTKLAKDPVAAIGQALEGLGSARGKPALARRESAIPFQRGVSFAMHNGLDTGYHAPGVDAQFERLRAMGVDAISLMPFAYQPRPDAPGLAFLNRSPRSETDVGAVHAARRAHEHGLHVLWKPHIWVSHQSWPGDIAMSSEAAWRAWFRAYRRYIVHHAMLADFAGADLFSIGVELGKTVEREAEWRHLIASVRRIFDGPLTYAGNWWGDYDRVPFWDALDVIGVDAYFPLATSADADDEALRAGARELVKRLGADARRFERPVLLTEIGYAARVGAWVSPHEEGGEISGEHHRRAWAALVDALGEPEWLRGLYAWKVFSHARVEHTKRPDFRFLERPARAELERYFRSLGPEPGGDAR